MQEVANHNEGDTLKRKKEEVRARLMAQTNTKAKNKGFMTPERKKMLKLLLRRKAAEALKRQQEVKAAERRKVIAERTGQPKNFDAMSESDLRSICTQMHERLSDLESKKWDLESNVSQKYHAIHELSTQVCDMRGKFIKPPLKRVPKYQDKIERMLLLARKEVGFTVNLKSVKKDQYKVEEENKDQPPQWSWKKDSKHSLLQAENSARESATNIAQKQQRPAKRESLHKVDVADNQAENDEAATSEEEEEIEAHDRDEVDDDKDSAESEEQSDDDEEESE